MSPRLHGLRVAVTGASGFCGAAVARAARDAGAAVVCLGRRPGPVGRQVFWDAASSVPELTGTDVVLHLAAAVGDPAPGGSAGAAFRAVNEHGTARLLRAAAGRPVVHVSSASVYRAAGPAPVTEEYPALGEPTPYGRSKAAGDRLALDAGAVVLRPRAVYGPGDPHLVPRLRRVLRGGRALLPGPDVQLSLTAVENLAQACLAALGWPAGPYNIADAGPYSRDAVVAAVLGVPVVHLPVAAIAAAVPVAAGLARLTGRPAMLTGYAVRQLSVGLVLDIGRALDRGWRPRRSLPDFLRDAAAPPIR